MSEISYISPLLIIRQDVRHVGAGRPGALTEANHRACAVTGERILPVLEAAHIKPFADSGPKRTDNGLLLRSDLHILFDRGYVTVTPDYRVEIGGRKLSIVT